MTSYFSGSTARTRSFYAFFTLLAILTFLATIGKALYLLYSGENDCSLYALIWVGGIALLALLLIYYYKKIGVILYPLAISLYIIFSNQDLFYNLPLIFLLFLYTGYGLVFIIPDWNKMK